MKSDFLFKEIDLDNFFHKWFDEYLPSDNFEELIGFDEDEFEDEEKSSSLKEKAHDYFFDRIDEFINDFEENAIVQDGYIICQRNIMVRDEDEFIFKISQNVYVEGYDGIGIFWSWDHSLAESHWGNCGVEMAIKAKIPIESIDIYRTIMLNFCPSIGRNEAEIRTKKGSPVFLIEINSTTLPNIEISC